MSSLGPFLVGLGCLILAILYTAAWMQAFTWSNRTSTDWQRDRRRALSMLPREVSRENHAVVRRRAAPIAFVLMVGPILAGVAFVVARDRTKALLVALLGVGLLATLLVVAIGVSRFQYLARSGGDDPALVDLGPDPVLSKGAAATRLVATLFGLACLAQTLLALRRQDLGLALFAMLVAIPALLVVYAGAGTRRFTERGVHLDFGFYPWSELVGWAWSSDGHWLALRLRDRGLRLPWVLVAMPPGQQRAVEEQLALHLKDAAKPVYVD